MPNKKDLKLDEFGISKHRYRELYNFCLQYEEKKAQKADCYSLNKVVIDGQPKGNKTGDPTASSAEKAYRLNRDLELIEQTAIEAGGELYPWLLKGVTTGTGYEVLYPPCGERQYHTLRRKFYYLLGLKK